MAQAGFVARALLEQPDIGVRGAGFGVVAVLLPFEVHSGPTTRSSTSSRIDATVTC